MKSSLQPQLRRFMAMLSRPGCCFSSDNVNRLSQAKFSRTCLVSDARLVLAIGHVEAPMAAIFNSPMTADGVGELLHAHGKLLM